MMRQFLTLILIEHCIGPQKGINNHVRYFCKFWVTKKLNYLCFSLQKTTCLEARLQSVLLRELKHLGSRLLRCLQAGIGVCYEAEILDDR